MTPETSALASGHAWQIIDIVSFIHLLHPKMFLMTLEVQIYLQNQEKGCRIWCKYTTATVTRWGVKQCLWTSLFVELATNLIMLIRNERCEYVNIFATFGTQTRLCPLLYSRCVLFWSVWLTVLCCLVIGLCAISLLCSLPDFFRG